MPTYKIIRFRQMGSNKVIKTGLTLEEAQAHCNDPKTSGEGWFDGYKEENPPSKIRKASISSVLQMQSWEKEIF